MRTIGEEDANVVVIPSVVFIHGLFGHPCKTWTWIKPRGKSARPDENQPSSLLLDRDKISQNDRGRALRKDNDLSSKKAEIPLHGYEENYRVSDQRSTPFTPDSMFWPRALLPDVVPNARIFTWGYDADVDGFLSPASQNRIHEHAGNLLVDLSNLRSTNSDRLIPLIFVVHSLGGIVVKDALNQSAANEGTRLKDIAPATFGIIFLSTPHRGSKSASIGKIACRITQLITKHPNLSILSALEKNSEILDRIGDQFLQTIQRHKISLSSFREEKEIKKYLLYKTMVILPLVPTFCEDRFDVQQVVSPDSARIGVATEEVSSIPSDHSNMAKYKSSNEIGFKRVSSQLRRWIEAIDQTIGRFVTRIP